MKIDIFSEIQRAGWERKKEGKLIGDSIELAKVADETGYGAWWQVEHNGSGAFSISSAPELFNAILARETQKIRLGQAGVLSPFKINHPLRVAARAAFTDIVSGGRVELGVARSSGNEWTRFQVDGETTREETSELLRMLPRMWSNDRFSWKSDLIEIPEVDVVPKPVQKPHPPMWLTGTAQAAFEEAGGLGVGAIATTMLWPIESIKVLVDAYRQAIDACEEPAGDVMNDQFGCFTFVHCAPSREEAIASGACEAALWYANTAPSVFNNPRGALVDAIRGLYAPDLESWRHSHEEKVEYAVDPDDPVPVVRLMNRQYLGMEIDPEEAYEVLGAIDSVIIGDPDTCLAKMKKFEEVGVDRLLTLQQFGALQHKRVLGSLRLIGEELVPQIDV
ncbi:MAG: LLM class flavin-dependent oxidoreductase [bacterium]|nr:LLM class flavin-dependent oxidoreductase [bacterium]